jgi:hypothetical protein
MDLKVLLFRKAHKKGRSDAQNMQEQPFVG